MSKNLKKLDRSEDNFSARKNLEIKILGKCSEVANEILIRELKKSWGKLKNENGISDGYLFVEEGGETPTEVLEDAISHASEKIIERLISSRPLPEDLERLLNDNQAMVELSLAFADIVLIEIERIRITSLLSQTEEAKQIAKKSIQDPIMGFINAKGSESAKALFDRQCAEDEAQARESDSELSVLFIDLDGFSRYNNRYMKHAMGDIILKHVANKLSAEIKKTDRIYKYGGEEIAIVLKDTDANEGCEVAERLRKEVEGHPCYVSYVIEGLDENGNEIAPGDPIIIKKGSYDRLLQNGKKIKEVIINGDKIIYVEDPQNGEIIALLEARLTISIGVAQCQTKENGIIKQTIDGRADHQMYLAKGKRPTDELKRLSSDIGLPDDPEKKLFNEESGEIKVDPEKGYIVISIAFQERLARYEDAWKKKFNETKEAEGKDELDKIQRIKILISAKNQIWVNGERYFPPQSTDTK